MRPLSRRQNLILRMAVIPTAALIASHVVFSQVFPGQPNYQFPWAYFLTVVTVMFSCWEVNLFIFRWLDNRLPFWQNPVRRLISQVLLGGAATLLTFTLIFPLSQRVYTYHWPAPSTVLKGLVVCITLASLVNGGYAGLYLLQAFVAEQQHSQDDIPKHVSELTNASMLVTIDVTNGQLRLPIDQIAYFYSTGGLVLLIKVNGQQITTGYPSVARLLTGLDNRYFFQLSRQFVVSLGAIRAVQDDINRKLVVTLVPALHKQDAHQDVIVSRYRRSELRKWLQASVEL